MDVEAVERLLREIDWQGPAMFDAHYRNLPAEGAPIYEPCPLCRLRRLVEAARNGGSGGA